MKDNALAFGHEKKGDMCVSCDANRLVTVSVRGAYVRRGVANDAKVLTILFENALTSPGKPVCAPQAL